MKIRQCTCIINKKNDKGTKDICKEKCSITKLLSKEIQLMNAKKIFDYS